MARHVTIRTVLRVYPRVLYRSVTQAVLVGLGVRKLTARNALTLEAASGRALYAVDADTLKPPASTLKLLNALAVRRWVPDDRLGSMVAIEPDEVGRAGFGLAAGDEVSIEDLLYGMLLPSANDCAAALARSVGQIILDSEGRDGDPAARFLEEMRTIAQESGGPAIVVADASGNHKASRISARQLTEVMRSVSRDALLRRIIGTRDRNIDVRGPRPRRIHVSNRFDPEGRVGFPEYIGSKTGSTSLAGSCIVVLWQHPERGDCITAILGSPHSRLRRRDLRWLIDSARALPLD